MSFYIKWYKKERNPIERTNVITVPSLPENSKEAEEAAIKLFTRAFGSLKRNEIVSITPVDEEESAKESITLEPEA